MVTLLPWKHRFAMGTLYRLNFFLQRLSVCSFIELCRYMGFWVLGMYMHICVSQHEEVKVIVHTYSYIYSTPLSVTGYNIKLAFYRGPSD